MENRNNTIPDEQLETVSGGAGYQPKPRYSIGEIVLVSYPVIPHKWLERATVTEQWYDESNSTWMYRVAVGSNEYTCKEAFMSPDGYVTGSGQNP